MRSRLQKQNIVACSILAVALYLNFIYKDSSAHTDYTAKNTQKAFTSLNNYSGLNEISIVTPITSQVSESAYKKYSD